MKHIILHIAFILTILTTFNSSCSKSDNAKARELFTQAQMLTERGEYTNALTTLNQLDSLYPREFDIRKQARHLRPKIVEQQALLQISENDSLMALEKWHGDSLATFLRLVKNPIENYYVAKNEPENINSRPGMYARMSPDATFYITVVTNGSKANSVEIKGVKSAILPFDNYRVTETNSKNFALTFLQAEIDSCLKALKSDPQNITVKLFNNGRGVGDLKLTASDVENILNVYNNALSVQRIKLLTINRERFEQTLSTARSQIARTAIDSIKQ